MPLGLALAVVVTVFKLPLAEADCPACPGGAYCQPGNLFCQPCGPGSYLDLGTTKFFDGEYMNANAANVPQTVVTNFGYAGSGAVVYNDRLGNFHSTVMNGMNPPTFGTDLG